jgi:sec-independent protein translocase protein TatC
MKDRPLTVVEHLSELRRRVVYCLLSVAVTSGFAYAFVDRILEFVMKVGNVQNLVFISPMEAFIVIVKLSLLAGIVAAMPFIMYQMWRYVGVALKENERKYLIYFGPVSYLLFLCGATLAFRGVMPLAIRFLLSFARENVTPLITLDSYIAFLGKMITAFGLMFQLPLVVLLLSMLGIVTPDFMKKARRYAIVIIFVVAAILTPPDALSQIMLAAPILLLYEASVWICIAVTKKREREEREGFTGRSRGRPGSPIMGKT